ncbi:MAG: ABC transporter permease [Brumimicrobium sp.]
MNKSILIAIREINERFNNRFYKWLMIIGPLLILGLIYIFLSNTTASKEHWNVLIMDKEEILQTKLSATTPKNLSIDFINTFVDYEDFAYQEKFQKYDLAVSINEKIISNKHVIISYRERPPLNVQRELVYLVERRVEEIMVEEFTDLTLEEFRGIKQSLSFNLKDTYDPRNENSTTAGWVGFGFGLIIIVFVFMFGMTILRSVAKEKANRIVEVLLSSVKARQLLTGKLLGIGFSAIIQFVVWIVIIGAGLYLFRITFFPDIFSGEFVADELLNSEGTANISQSPFVELIYRQIQYVNMLIFFTFFFIGGYLFYGSFFAMIGASMGSESDGQQFVIPLTLLLLLALYSGYYTIYFPNSVLAQTLSFIPFTSPMTMMVKLANGFEVGTSWQLFASLIVLYLSALIMILLASRIYKNGLLRFNHRLRLKMLLKWTRK